MCVSVCECVCVRAHAPTCPYAYKSLCVCVSTQLGFNINISKTKIMKANTKNNNPITWNGEPLDSFTYLGNTINKNGGAEEDVTARTQKARVAFIMLRKQWRAKQIKINT